MKIRIVGIFSAMQDSWDPLLGADMQANSVLYTFYEMAGAGAASVRKVLYPGSLFVMATAGASSAGFQTHFPVLYVENWIPLKRPPFNAMALDVDEHGAPRWWYDEDIFPYYSAFSETPGYAVVFDPKRRTTAPMVGVAYGRHAMRVFMRSLAGQGTRSEHLAPLIVEDRQIH